LGLCYFKGVGVTADPKCAAQCFKAAAQRGDVRACWEFSECLRFGDGVREDVFEATKWARIAAEHGYQRAQLRMGVIYTQGGMGPASNEEEALRWFKAAANHWTLAPGMGAAWPRCAYKVASASLDQGELLALDDLLVQLRRDDVAGRFLARICFNIGALYAIGQPAGFSFERANLGAYWVKAPDFDKSVYFYRRAAALDDPRAQFALAKCFETGCGMDRDIGQALSILEHLVHLGYPQAQLKLARWREIGHAVEVDKRLATRLYKKAGSQIVEEMCLDGDDPSRP